MFPLSGDGNSSSGDSDDSSSSDSDESSSSDSDDSSSSDEAKANDLPPHAHDVHVNPTPATIVNCLIKVLTVCHMLVTKRDWSHSELDQLEADMSDMVAQLRAAFIDLSKCNFNKPKVLVICLPPYFLIHSRFMR